MINANELRIGNWVFGHDPQSMAHGEQRYFKVDEISEDGINCWRVEGFSNEYAKCEPIPLTPEILEKCGFKQLPHYTVQNNWNISLGRDRVISVANVGTPNEMVFINEEQPPEVKNIIVARNYDYDGYTYLHQLQNLFYCLCGEELKCNL